MDYLYHLDPETHRGPFETEQALLGVLRRIDRAGSASMFTVHVFHQRSSHIRIAVGTISAEAVLENGGVDHDQL